MALTNAQYDAILRLFQQKQLKNKHILDERFEEVYKKSPELLELDRSISSVSVQQAKKLLSGQEDALTDLKSELAVLRTKRADLLSKAGFSPAYLEAVYDCPVCHDTGYVNNKKCVCFKKAVTDMLYMQSNIRDILKEENFSNFSYDYYSDKILDDSTSLTSRQAIEKAYKESKAFIETFDTEFRNLFFYGNTGLGKTFLSHCIAKELIDSAHSVIYFTAFQLFELFADRQFHRESSNEMADDYILNCDLLIVDDLGTELTNSFVSSELFLCINERILNKKSTIISTNLSLERLIQTYSERTFSRISSNYRMLKLVGKDIRIQKKLNSKYN